MEQMLNILSNLIYLRINLADDLNETTDKEHYLSKTYFPIP